MEPVGGAHAATRLPRRAPQRAHAGERKSPCSLLAAGHSLHVACCRICCAEKLLRACLLLCDVVADVCCTAAVASAKFSAESHVGFSQITCLMQRSEAGMSGKAHLQTPDSTARHAWARRGRPVRTGTGRRRARLPTRLPTLPRRPPLVHPATPTLGSCQARSRGGLWVYQRFTSCNSRDGRPHSGRRRPGAAARGAAAHGAAGVLSKERAACPGVRVESAAGKPGCAKLRQRLGLLLPSWPQRSLEECISRGRLLQ